MSRNTVSEISSYNRIVQPGLDTDGYEAASIDVILHVNVRVLVCIKLYD